MKKLILAAITAVTILSPVNVCAKQTAPIRYTTGVVTGAKLVTTKDGNIWETKRKLHLRKGTKVTIKFDTCGTRRKTDDRILSVKRRK